MGVQKLSQAQIEITLKILALEAQVRCFWKAEMHSNVAELDLG